MTEWTGVRDKRVLITGATHGIGLAGAEALARRGAHVAIVARSEARAVDAVRRIEAAGGSKVDVLHADLSSQASVRALAAEALERYPSIEVLVNNAGAMFTTRHLTEDGIEQTWALNHLAPFLLTTLLLDRLKASAPSRIITTTSDAHKGKLIPFDDINAERSYRGMGFTRYGESKLANILFTAELSRRLHGTGVTTYCFHPGPRRDRFQPQQRRVDERGDAADRSVLQDPKEGCAHTGLAGQLAGRVKAEWRLLR